MRIKKTPWKTLDFWSRKLEIAANATTNQISHFEILDILAKIGSWHSIF